MSATSARLLGRAERVTGPAIGYFLVATGFVTGHGGPGVVAALAVGVCWLLRDGRVASVLAAVALGALGPVSLATLVLVGGGVSVGLGAHLLRATRSVRTLAAFAVASGAALVVLGAGLSASLPTWTLAALVLGTVALLGYGVHRYELVMLDLVPDSTYE